VKIAPDGVPADGIGDGRTSFPALPDGVRQARVLVVDDNPANVLLLRRVLRAAGLSHVEGCTDSSEAIERCRTALPDLLLLDLHMPHPDGFEVMESLRSVLAPDAFLPVLVLTADVGSDVKRRALAAGAKDFLTKPLDNVEVVLRVGNLLQTEQLVRSLGDAVATQERAVRRERALRRAAVSLGAAGADHHALREAALDAAAALAAETAGVTVRLDIGPSTGAAGAEPGASVTTVPVALRGTPYGAFVVTGSDAPSGEVLDALDTLAAQLALALETAALTEDLRRREGEDAAAVLVQHSSDVILVVDGHLAIRFQTPSAEAVLGYRAGALLGARFTSLFRPQQVEAAEAHYAAVAARAGARPPAEWTLRRADGSHIPVEVVSNNLLDDPRVGGIVLTIRDMTERKAYEEGLRRQVDELRKLDRLKNDLVSTVSHELRTPLTSILGHTEMLADGDSGPLTPEQSHVVGIIDRNGHRLLALVEDLLTLARVESKGLELDLAPLSVPALIANTRDSIQPSVTARSQTLVVDVDPTVGDIVADGSMIDRALANLLSNAIKFTPEGGTVRLGVVQGAGEVVFTVSDTGMGIAPEDRDRLFTRFFRSSEATTNAIPGTGLGLSIVKQIVDAHRGVINIESELGKGQSVSFPIPVAAGRA